MNPSEATKTPALVPAGPEALARNAEQRHSLRRRLDRAELRLALGDLAESLRGFIRAAPLTTVALAASAGVAFARRKRRRV